jgi:hypothetical protein
VDGGAEGKNGENLNVQRLGEIGKDNILKGHEDLLVGVSGSGNINPMAVASAEAGLTGTSSGAETGVTGGISGKLNLFSKYHVPNLFQILAKTAGSP